jgi:Lrp/AsnC family transcriptional regulator, leucine-responsive regulatory protein
MPMLDDFDRSILDTLQNDGRLTHMELSERIHLSPTPTSRRVKALESQGLITGYQARLDRQKIGLGLTVIVGLKVDGHRDANATAIQEAFRGMPEVITCHLISGEFDFLLECVFPDIARYEQFLMGQLLKLPMVKDVRSNFVIRTVKEGWPLPLEHLRA